MVVLNALGYRMQMEAVPRTITRNITTGHYHPVVMEKKESMTNYQDLQYYGIMQYGSNQQPMKMIHSCYWGLKAR